MTAAPQGRPRHAARISYELEIWGEVRKQELPFVIGVIGDFSHPDGQRRPADERRFFDVSRDNVTDLLAEFAPGIDVSPGDAVDVTESITPLEKSWRRLLRLVNEIPVDPTVKIRALDVTRAELAEMFRNAISPDQSSIVRIVYEHEYGQFGGEPYGLLLVDFEFDHRSSDVLLLDNLARMGATAMCPVIAAAAPEMFGAEQWEALARRGRLQPVFSSRAYLEWRSFREREYARHLALTVPVRKTVAGAAPIDTCSLVSALVRGYVNTGGWYVEEALPGQDSSESLFSGDRIAEFAECGFLPLCTGPEYGPLAMPTVQRPPVYRDPDRTASLQRQALLPVVLASMEFGRAVKCIVRDMIGSFLEVDDMQARLNQWISNYVTDATKQDGDDRNPDRPLDEGRVEVSNPPGLGRGSGYYSVQLYLRPRLPGVEFARDICCESKVPAGTPGI